MRTDFPGPVDGKAGSREGIVNLPACDASHSRQRGLARGDKWHLDEVAIGIACPPPPPQPTS